MTEPAERSEAARLDELAAVTREYAAYSRTAYGVAALSAGMMTFALLTSDLLWRAESAKTAYYLLAPAWLFALTFTRRCYQRHGTVIERDRELVHGRRREIQVVYLLSASHAFFLSRGGIELSGAGWLKLGALFAVIAVPLLAAEWLRSGTDFSITNALLMAVMLTAADERVSVVGAHVFLAVTASFLVASGFREHVRHRSIERRLAGLKGSA